MKFHVRCVTCNHTCWIGGEEEADTNAFSPDEQDLVDEGCEHLREGGDFIVFESETEDEYDG